MEYFSTNCISEAMSNVYLMNEKLLFLLWNLDVGQTYLTNYSMGSTTTKTLTKCHIYYEITNYEKQKIGEKLQHENLSTLIQNILYIAYLSVSNHSDPKSLGGSWDCECSP
jgi:hypothetical protein